MGLRVEHGQINFLDVELEGFGIPKVPFLVVISYAEISRPWIKR